MTSEIAALTQLSWPVAVEVAHRLMHILTHRGRFWEPAAATAGVEQTTRGVLEAIQRRENGRPITDIAPERVEEYLRELARLTEQLAEQEVRTRVERARQSGKDFGPDRGPLRVRGLHNLALVGEERERSVEGMERQFRELVEKVGQGRISPTAEGQSRVDILKQDVLADLRSSALLPAVKDLEMHLVIDEEGDGVCLQRQTVTTVGQPLTKVLHEMQGDTDVASLDELGIHVKGRDKARQITRVPLKDEPKFKSVVVHFDPGIEQGASETYSVSWRWPAMWARLAQPEPEVDNWRQQFYSATPIARVRIRFSLHPKLPIISLQGQGGGRAVDPAGSKGQMPGASVVNKRGYLQYLWEATHVPPSTILDIQLHPQ